MTLDDPDLVPLEQPERARARPEDVPLVVLTAAELLALPLRPRGMVLDPVIPEQGLAMLYSKRGVGKTFRRWPPPMPSPAAAPSCAGRRRCRARCSMSTARCRRQPCASGSTRS